LIVNERVRKMPAMTKYQSRWREYAEIGDHREKWFEVTAADSYDVTNDYGRECRKRGKDGKPTERRKH
jgi:hypothetical protein